MAKGQKSRSSSGIRQFDGSRKRLADDCQFSDIPLPGNYADNISWEDIHEIYHVCCKMLTKYQEGLTGSAHAYHMRTVAALNGLEYQIGIQNNIDLLGRDIRAWVNIADQVFDSVRHDTGKVPNSRMLEWHDVGVQLSNIMEGIENSLTPLLNEIATWVVIGDQNIIGYNLAELEALPKEQRQSLITHQYTAAIENHNASGKPRIDLKSVLANILTDNNVKHLN